MFLMKLTGFIGRVSSRSFDYTKIGIWQCCKPALFPFFEYGYRYGLAPDPVQLRIGMPWMSIQMRQNDADPDQAK
jgi:hypothetical protein